MDAKYNYLLEPGSPRVIVEALKLYGTQEIVGKQHSPIILGWAEKIGLKSTYTNDEIPWCGLFVAYVCFMAGKAGVKNPLWARNWATWGVKQTIAMRGDILVFVREGGGGHVGFYVGEDATCYHILGGNQSNKVNITRILKSRCIAIRRDDWKVSQPIGVRVNIVGGAGAISTNEA